MAQSLVPKRKVVILHETATVFEAARAMCSQEIGCVLVCDEKGNLTGLVTDRDLACTVVGGNLSIETKLDKIMTHGVWSVDEKAGAEDIFHLMKEHGIRRIAVVQENKGGFPRATGIVSLDDLIISQQISIEDAARIVRSQILHRQHFIQPLREAEVQADTELREFIERTEERSGLNRTTTLSLLTILMSSIVRSVHYSVAEKLLAPLPLALRLRLEDLPAGPDASLTADFLIGEVVVRFNLEPEHAKEVIRQFWDGLATSYGSVEMEKFAEKLPEDLRDLVVPPLIDSISSETSTETIREPQNPLHMH